MVRAEGTRKSASYILSGVMQGGGGCQSMQVSSARAWARFERDIHTEAILGADSPAWIVDPLEMCKVRAPAMLSPCTAPDDMFQ